MQENVTVAIMAGGNSSRMGRDKSFVPFRGQPMIESVKEQVVGLGEETILITNKPQDYAHLQLPMFSDIYPDHGPLGGIFTAVSQANHSHVLVVACDMPWLSRDLLDHMLDLRKKADIIVPLWDKHPEPLHAVYSKTCLEPIEAKLREKALKITGFFEEMDVLYLDREEIKQFDEHGRSFANINTPQDLETGRQQA